MGLEGPAEELLAWGGVLGDQQNRADGSGPCGGAVEVSQAGAVGGGVAVGAVAPVAGVVGEGARQSTAKDRAAAALGVALRDGPGGFGEEPDVRRFNGVAQLPGVAPAVSGGIGMGADDRKRRAGVVRQGVHQGGKSPEGGIELQAHPSGLLAGPLPAARREGLAEHLIGHGVGPAVGVGSLVRSRRP